jgi:hypothetical protein
MYMPIKKGRKFFKIGKKVFQALRRTSSFNSFIKTNDIKEQRLEKYRNAILNTKN